MCPTRIHSGKDSFSLSYIGDLLMTLSPEDSLEREASSAEKLEMDFCIPGGGGGIRNNQTRLHPPRSRDLKVTDHR